ncbi:MAG: glycosyltransferase family 39 protein, partial [Verrucomicrobiota bacterium]|nr:glycosyltransferase family 39 protein [Verrucomicrobiota bacterium]
MLFEAAVEIAFARVAAAFEQHAGCRTKQNVAVRAGVIPLIAVLLAILHVALAVTATIDKSPTFDEPVHLTAGYSYWLRNDFRFDPENGNLPARWAALPLVASRPNFPAPDSFPWNRVLVGKSSQQFFYQLGNNPDDMLLKARIMMSVFSGALCLLIFFCAQRLFGPTGGLISETVAVFDPTLLAHGALVTADIPAAFFFTVAVWSFWRLLHYVSPCTLAFSVLSIAGLFLTKMSAPLFLFMAAILCAVRIFSRAPIEIQLAGFQQIIPGKIQKTVMVAALVMTIGIAVVIAIWASFCFRFSALTENGPPRQMWDARWDLNLADHGVPEKIIAFARDHRLLPEAYLYGLAYVNERSQYRPAFLDNHWSNVGFVSFFPRAFFYKTPLPIFGLLAMTLLVAAVRWKRRLSDAAQSMWGIVGRDCMQLAPILTLVVVYGGFALVTKLNIGHRHLLPIYPSIFIACGACAYFLRKRPLRIAGAMIVLFLAWQLIDSWCIRPNYLAYFNQIAGGPENGYKHLVDSSLDWGQDLPALKTWLDERKDQLSGNRVYLAYFGTADPAWYKIPATTLPENAEPLLPLRSG